MSTPPNYTLKLITFPQSTNANNNISSGIPQVGSGDGRVYSDLTATSWRKRETISERPSAQV